MTWAQPTRTHTFNPIAFGLVFAGAVCVGVGLTVGTWLGGSDDATAPEIHKSLTATAPAISEAFFTWLAWFLLAALIVLGTLGVCPLPGAASTALRLITFTVSVVAIGIGLVAIVEYVGWIFDLVRSLSDDASAVLDVDNPARFVVSHGGYGLWLTLGGFLAIGVGGLIGPLPR